MAFTGNTNAITLSLTIKTLEDTEHIFSIHFRIFCFSDVPNQTIILTPGRPGVSKFLYSERQTEQYSLKF